MNVFRPFKAKNHDCDCNARKTGEHGRLTGALKKLDLRGPYLKYAKDFGPSEAQSARQSYVMYKFPANGVNYTQVKRGFNTNGLQFAYFDANTKNLSLFGTCSFGNPLQPEQSSGLHVGKTVRQKKITGHSVCDLQRSTVYRRGGACQGARRAPRQRVRTQQGHTDGRRNIGDVVSPFHASVPRQRTYGGVNYDEDRPRKKRTELTLLWPNLLPSLPSKVR
uniref:Putative endonuclease n=1 Tax=Ixodes ricinus TaxID=34613 RepID=A0A0K8R7Q0_IXORI